MAKMATPGPDIRCVNCGELIYPNQSVTPVIWLHTLTILAECDAK